MCHGDLWEDRHDFGSTDVTGDIVYQGSLSCFNGWVMSHMCLHLFQQCSLQPRQLLQISTNHTHCTEDCNQIIKHITKLKIRFVPGTDLQLLSSMHHICLRASLTGCLSLHAPCTLQSSSEHRLCIQRVNRCPDAPELAGMLYKLPGVILVSVEIPLSCLICSRHCPV